jgi:Chromo (CHRromatin Organisation MOdifier) domain
MNNVIYNNYINPSHPTAFSSIGNIHRFYKGKYRQSEIRKALAHVDSYTLHREVKRPKTYNPFFIYSLREQVQMDLIDVRQLAAKNDGVTFILTAIDCFSKKAWLKTLVNKTAANTLEAIKELTAEIQPPMRSIFLDRGKEFLNKLVYDFMSSKNIKIMHPNSEKKAAIVERFNRSIQDLIYRYLTENETQRYIDVLQDLLSAYNNRGHRTLQYMSPNDAEKPENTSKVLCALNTYYSKSVGKKQQPKLSVGQTVRVAKIPERFSRGYQERFNWEHYKIVDISTRMPIPMYKLQSMNDMEIIQGNFYSNELQPVDGDTFKIEKTLGERKRRGKTEYLVKWKGFDDRHNSWEPAENIVKDYQNNQT